MTFALDAETTGGWCLPEAQLAIAGIQVARSIYDYLTVPDDKGGYVPDLATAVTPNAELHASGRSSSARASSSPTARAFDAKDVVDNLNAYRGKFAEPQPARCSCSCSTTSRR